MSTRYVIEKLLWFSKMKVIFNTQLNLVDESGYLIPTSGHATGRPPVAMETTAARRQRRLWRLRIGASTFHHHRGSDSGSGAVYSTTKDWVNLSVVATISSWPDGHRTVTTDWTTSDRQSPSSSNRGSREVSGAALLSKSSRICVRPVATYLVPSTSTRLYTASSE